MSKKPTYGELEQRIKELSREVETHKRTESERPSHLHFREIIDKIDQVIRDTNDIDKMMRDVLETVLSIFQCDRVWLMYPCDPEADFWRVPMECTRPEYPGAFALNEDIPITSEMIESFKAVLKSKEPLVFHPEHGLPLPDSAKQFSIQSSINSALYPKVGNPWMWGLSQCSHARQWSKSEISIFQEIGRRISDSLSILLTLRNLKESEEKYRHLSEGTFEAVVWHDEGKIIEANDRYYKMFGYKPEELAGKDAILLTAIPSSVKFMREQISLGHLGPYEVVGMKKDGTEFPMEIRVKKMQYKGKIARMAAIRDLTESKHAEEALRESEERYRNLVEEQSELICRYTSVWKLTFVNEAYCQYFGKRPEELIGSSFMRLIPVEDQKNVAQRHHTMLSSNLKNMVHEHQVIDRKGEIRWQQWVNRAVCDKSGLLKEYQSVGRDITERKKSETELKKSIKEKELLIKELNHRVKNNFEIISSLLDMSCMHKGNREFQNLCEDARARIYSMALIHSQLYQADRFDQIDMGRHIQELVDHLSQVYKEIEGRITTMIEPSEVYLSVNQAIPCALVLNELITNAVKHAFKERGKGTVHISINNLVGDTIQITVKDDGSGISEGFDLSDATGLGLKLARHLVVGQLKGEMRCNIDNGTEFQIEFEKVE